MFSSLHNVSMASRWKGQVFHDGNLPDVCQAAQRVSELRSRSGVQTSCAAARPNSEYCQHSRHDERGPPRVFC